MTRLHLHRLTAALALGASLAAWAAAEAPLRASDFAWRAALQAPADAALLRVELPAAALGALQSRSNQDIRVFDSQGQALPLALLPVPARGATETAGATVQALPLLHPQQGGSQGERMTARVEVASGEGGSGLQQLQVQWSRGASAPEGNPGAAWQAALFDLRGVKDPVAALDVSLSLPDNTPLHLQASSSRTLQQWQSLPVTGPLYHFAGQGAPHSTRLQFASAQSLHDQFLLLQWPAQAGVQVQAVRPQLLSAAPPPARVELGLPAGTPVPHDQGLEWRLPPGAQVQSVQWTLAAGPQLRTFQLQGRRAPATLGGASPAWEPLGSLVLYRLVQDGVERRNGPQPLPPGAWTALRLRDWPTGNGPAPESLQASLGLEPVRLAFMANGQPPYTLAVGRADTPAAALPLNTLTRAAASEPEAWPLASLGAVETEPAAPASHWGGSWVERWRDGGGPGQARIGLLWLVLAIAVLALAWAAYTLLRANQRRPAEAEPPGRAPQPPAS